MDNTISLSAGVAIITYNGLKYLPHQLKSITSHSRAVDHIVVSDDQSTDGTWEFLQSWAEQTPFRTSLIRNEKQLGLIANFEQAISAVEADIIFTSDQDDIWFPEKVEKVVSLFENQKDLTLVHTDALLVDSQGQSLDKQLFDELELSEEERRAIDEGNAFQVYLRRNIVTGATAAFRRDLLQIARPFPTSLYHDAWIALMASASGKVRLIDKPMISYRQHEGNLVGVKKLNRLTKMRHLWWKIGGQRSLQTVKSQIISQRMALHTRLSAHPGVHAICREDATEALKFAQHRLALPTAPVRRLGAVLADVISGRYKRFTYETKSDILRDILNK